MHQENYEEDGKLKHLHVFARTHNAPYKFFYRKWNEYMKWSAWEKVQLDIRSVEDGDNSGVHLIPVVWKKRLFLFWPEFMEVQEAPEGNSSKSVEQVGTEQNISSLEANKHWEIRLAWSEYVDGKWSPKQVSKEINKVTPDESEDVHISDFEFHTYILQNDELRIVFSEQHTDDGFYRRFRLFDIQSKVEIYNVLEPDPMTGISGYESHFMKKTKQAPLALKDNTYLQSSVNHKLLYSHQLTDFETKLAYPFFYFDTDRTYFVRPVDIRIIYGIKNPGYCKPYIREIYECKEDVIPDFGPDVFMPVEGIAEGVSAYFMASRNMNQPVMRAFTDSGNANMPVSRAMMMRSGNVATGVTSARKSASKNYGMEMKHVEAAFGADIAAGLEYLTIDYDKGLEFHTFYHPFSSKYVTNLNQGGLPGLMESDTEDPEMFSDDGKTFEETYDPNDTHGLVQKPSDFDTRTYYKENVCFDVYGANSLYNWELFFHAPLYIATRLSKNGKYEEAMKWFHYIFDPTTDEEPEADKETARYWKVLPFKTTPAKTLEELFLELNKETDPSSLDYNPNSEYFRIVSEWRDNPFDPHLVASNRSLAYMKHVIIKYVENLIAWGDSLFRQFTREGVNEALQIYVIANHILGPKPEFVPKRGETAAESYHLLKDKWDDFSNALVELENIFPYSSEVSVGSTSSGTSFLGIGPALYFCIPANDKLLEYWDTVADRLFKIRHCQDLDGVEHELALFAPPISPEALIQAVSQGLSLGSILADLSSPPPIYRFTYLIQKANEFCSDVKALGSALLAALEKKDAEELSRLRASHETQMLELVTAIRERGVLDAKANKENLLKARETGKFRLQHYIDLLGNESVTVPAAPTIGATLTEELEQSRIASDWQDVANWTEMAASLAYFIPDFFATTAPLGAGVQIQFGGKNVGPAISAVAKGANALAATNLYDAQKASKLAGYIRREQDWTLQANLAAREIIQLDKQDYPTRQADNFGRHTNTGGGKRAGKPQAAD
jgi:hypothetical protein